MAVDRELGAGSWSYFGDPRAISHDGDTFTGWISTTGNVWVARYTAGGQLTKRVIFKGLGRDDHNNPSLVFRHDGHIMVFFSPHSGHHLPPPGIPSKMCYMVSLNPYSINGFGKVHTVDTNVPGGLGYTYPNPVRLRTGCGCSGVAAPGTRPSPTPTTASTGCPPASSSTSGTRSGRTRSTSATARASTASSPTVTRRTGRTACTTCACRTAPCTRRAGPARHAGPGAAAHLQARPHLQLLRPGRARMGARHRAHRRGPPAGRLHAPRRQPRHLLLRLPQRHEVDQPQDHRGRRGPPVLPLGRRDPRPRGSAHRLPVAHDRPLEPGRAVVHAGLGPHVDAPAAHHDPNGYAIRPVTPRGLSGAPTAILYVWGDERTIGFTDYTTRVHALDF